MFIEKDESLFKDISNAQRRYITQRTIANDAFYIKELLFEDYVRLCTKRKNKYDCLEQLIIETCNEFWNKEMKDSQKKHLNSFRDMVCEDFFGKNSKIKIINVARVGYDGYAYRFKIQCDNVDFVFEFPMLSEINTVNFDDANEGKIRLGYSSADCIIHNITSSYKVEDIAEAIAQFLANKGENYAAGY